MNEATIASAERISTCTAALASGADSWAASRAYFLRGQAHFDERDFEAAVADFSRFIHSYPSNVQGYQVRAAAYLRQGNFDLAIADRSRVIEIGPKDPLAYAYRGEAYGAKGDFDHSLADLNKAIEINPNVKVAYCLRGHDTSPRATSNLPLPVTTRRSTLIPTSRLRMAGAPLPTGSGATLILR
ncbi:tetratricopeptide repeat protein [Bradyrhizobium sp. th.b2]|uniref:tetratricopeptide repeat protein n=1 Tax=Bradyrhizobium sp. th-b2 TaxID=172088 RepID=UPI00048FDC17|nr:tetratricopeptide repeat protein [Bradyrhizobium sp. th.b2]